MLPKYRPFNAKLTIDWDYLSYVDDGLGNAPGIYPDVALLLEQAVALSNIHTIVEFGSGASTIYLNAVARRHAKSVETFEEDEKWRRVNLTLLERMGVEGSIKLYADFDPSLRPDLIFLDCQPKLRWALSFLHPHIFAGCQMLLVDDTEKEWIRQPLMDFLAANGRTNSYFFNPTEREDRTVLINPLDQAFDIPAWVESWLPT